MLYCLYHPTLEMQVVDDEERERLLETGVWFDHPLQAQQMRQDYERQIQNERTEPQRENESQQSKTSRKIHEVQCGDDQQRGTSTGIGENNNKRSRQRSIPSQVKETKHATSDEDNE